MAHDGREQPPEPFSGRLLRHRGRSGLTQRELASRVGVNMRTIQGWETGVMYPTSGRLEALIQALLEAGAFWPARELSEAEALWHAVEREAPRTHPPFERAWFESLTRASQAALTSSPPAVINRGGNRDHRQDWGDAPAGLDFVGRATELVAVRRWVVDEKCRLLGVLGMGGIGKTTMA